MNKIYTQEQAINEFACNDEMHDDLKRAPFFLMSDSGQLYGFEAEDLFEVLAFIKNSK